MVRIWNVKFGSFTSENVEAPNIKRAIEKVRSSRRGQYCNRIQDITEVELLAET